MGDVLGINQWDEQVDKVLLMTEQCVTGVLQERKQSDLDGLLTYIDVSKKDVLYMDSGHSREVSTEHTIATLNSWQDYEISINDNVALGMLLLF